MGGGVGGGRAGGGGWGVGGVNISMVDLCPYSTRIDDNFKPHVLVHASSVS